MKALLAAATAAALAAAGCDRTAAASTTAATQAAPTHFPATAPSAPPGRWAYVHQVDGVESYRDERCRISEDTLAEIMMIGTPPARGCTRSIAEQGGVWTMHTACGGGEMAITVHTIVTGDFNNGYVVEATRVSGPGIDDFTSQKIKLDAERLGDC